MKHKHIWKHDTARTHGNKQRVYVVCTVPGCGVKAQAQKHDGRFGTPFSTARHFAGERKSVHGNYRLPPSRVKRLLNSGRGYKSIQDFLDNCNVL